ncbi:hypothetical protein [Streptomyces sp. NPDC023838]
MSSFQEQAKPRQIPVLGEHQNPADSLSVRAEQFHVGHYLCTRKRGCG